jgi:hypothetical protein
VGADVALAAADGGAATNGFNTVGAVLEINRLPNAMILPSPVKMDLAQIAYRRFRKGHENYFEDSLR